MVSVDDRPRREIEAEAAAWLARLNGPYRSERSEGAFKRWLRQNPLHEQAFERAAEVWEMIPGAGAGMETTGATERESAPAPRRGLVAVAAGLLAMIAVGGGYTLLSQPPVHVTETGEQELVVLDDGSRVSLNTNSRVSIHYSRGERRVRLDQGEAMFEVARQERPFTVISGNERIRALGTTFIVRRDRDARTTVTLIRGRIEVSEHVEARPPARIAVLSPGERIIVTPTAGAALDRPSIEAATAWRRGEVIFEDATLLEAAEELNRYGADRLVVADPTLADLRVSGVFSTDNPGEAAQAIAQLHGLRVRRQGSDLRLTRG